MDLHDRGRLAAGIPERVGNPAGPDLGYGEPRLPTRDNYPGWP